jgi:phospholipid-transporting ATPase
VHLFSSNPGANSQFRNNAIKTSKYTCLNFLPKNLVVQFSKMANVYFLIISIMQCINIISISGGKPVMLMPLSFVIVISMIKDIFEDYKRHKSDHLENFKKASVFDETERTFVERYWH